MHLVAFGLCDIHLIVDACRRVKVEDKVLKTHTLWIPLHRTDEQHGVIRRVHLLCPCRITHFQIVFDFLPCEQQSIEVVFKPVEVEKITHPDVTSLDGGVKKEWSTERKIGTAHFQLQILNQVNIGRRTEIGIRHIHTIEECAYLFSGKTLHLMKWVCKMTAERIGVLVVQRTNIVEGTQRFMTGHLALFVYAEIHVNNGYTVSITAGVDARNVTSTLRGHFLHVARMVMPI